MAEHTYPTGGSTDPATNTKLFAELADGLVSDALQKLQFDWVMEQAAVKFPFIKAMGKDIGVMQIRNTVYQLVLKKPKESKEFFSWLSKRLDRIVEWSQSIDFDP